MPVLTTTPDTNFTIPAAGNFAIRSTAPVRLLARIAGADFVPAGDCPETGSGSGQMVGVNPVAGATYRVQLLQPGATFEVEQ